MTEVIIWKERKFQQKVEVVHMINYGVRNDGACAIGAIAPHLR
jgi:hypothetical protein